MRRLVVFVAAMLLVVSAPAGAATVRASGTVKWAVAWSIRWNGGNAIRGFDLDRGRVADYDDLNPMFSCDGGPRTCSWSLFATAWKRPSRPSKAACRSGWESDDLQPAVPRAGLAEGWQCRWEGLVRLERDVVLRNDREPVRAVPHPPLADEG